MREFPSLNELPSFIGDEIVQVWLDPWGLRILFSSEIQLYVEHRIEYSDTDGTIWLYDTQAEIKAPITIQRLLYQKIVSFIRDDLCLTFKFFGGASLAIFSEIGQYESGHFLLPNGSFEVF